MDTLGAVATEEHRSLRCPYCEGTEVERLFLASLQIDSCDCRECGARWDERWGTGEFLGRDGARADVNRRRR